MAAALRLQLCSKVCKSLFTHPFTAASILIAEYHRLPLTSPSLDVRQMVTMSAIDKHVSRHLLLY